MKDPTKQAAELERQKKIAARLKRRGLKYCGCPKRTGDPCFTIIRKDAAYCPAHDPTRIEREALSLLEYDSATRKQAIADAAQREATLGRQLPAKEQMLQQLRVEIVEAEQQLREIQWKRDELTRGIVTLERERADFRADCEQSIAGLLRRATAYLEARDDELSPELCALMVQCAAELTNHQREARLAKEAARTTQAAPQPPATSARAEDIRNGATPAERLARYRDRGVY